MKNLKLSISLLLVFIISSCSQLDRHPDRFPSSDNEVAIERVSEACNVQYNKLSQLVFDNAITNEARYLSGGTGYQTFLMKDGRLVIVSGVNKRTKSAEKCKIDHLKMDEGPILGTYALGRRLFMTIENKETKKRRVYVLTAIKDQKSQDPYQLHEMMYTKVSSYAQAYGFRRTSIKTDQGSKYGVHILKENGDAYKYRTFEPWLWGDNNENIVSATNERARAITIRDERDNNQISLKSEPVPPEQKQQTVTYLPSPSKTCYVEDKISFFFGLFSVTETVAMPCQ